VTPRASVGAVLASALRKVVGGRLQQSNLGEVWREDRTWLELAKELDGALNGKLVLIDRKVFERIHADAEHMREIRKRFEAYEELRSKDQRENGERSRNAYARWAAENMPPKEGT
jgi:hypothetical protein